jgi:hypothetical protein
MVRMCFLAFLLFGCSKSVSESQQIYLALFSQLSLQKISLYVSEKPIDIGSIEGEKQIFSDFNFEKNNSTIKLESVNQISFHYLSETELNSMFFHGCSEGWKLFHTKYPQAQGFIRMSNIGFNQSRSRAIIYLEGRSGCLGGSGSAITFKKNNGVWVIDQERNL